MDRRAGVPPHRAEFETDEAGSTIADSFLTKENRPSRDNFYAHRNHGHQRQQQGHQENQASDVEVSFPAWNATTSGSCSGFATNNMSPPVQESCLTCWMLHLTQVIRPGYRTQFWASCRTWRCSPRNTTFLLSLVTPECPIHVMLLVIDGRPWTFHHCHGGNRVGK